MDEPAAVLKTGRRRLHSPVVNPLSIDVPSPGYGVNLSVKIPGRHKTRYGEFAGRNGVPVHNGIGGRHFAKTVIRDRLAVEAAELRLFVKNDQPIPGILFPVVCKAIRIRGVFPEIVGGFKPFNPKLYRTTFHGTIIPCGNSKIPVMVVIKF
jgi:hypothetical protein